MLAAYVLSHGRFWGVQREWRAYSLDDLRDPLQTFENCSGPVIKAMALLAGLAFQMGTIVDPIDWSD